VSAVFQAILEDQASTDFLPRSGATLDLRTSASLQLSTAPFRFRAPVVRFSSVRRYCVDSPSVLKRFLKKRVPRFRGDSHTGHVGPEEPDLYDVRVPRLPPPSLREALWRRDNPRELETLFTSICGSDPSLDTFYCDVFTMRFSLKVLIPKGALFAKKDELASKGALLLEHARARSYASPALMTLPFISVHRKDPLR
jgi:hypothetical protein